LVTGVWVGAEDRSVRFTRTSLGQGANTALPVWCYYMKKVWADSNLKVPVRPFDLPESLKSYNIDCDNNASSPSFDGDEVDMNELFGG